MPFKSKAQQRYMFAAEARGEIPKGTARRWAHHTKSIKSLPERKHKKSSAYEAGCALGMEKQSTAWLGRNIFMPTVRGASLPIEWLLKKIYGPAGEAVGRFRGNLRRAGRITSATPDELAEQVLARRGGAAGDTVPWSGWSDEKLELIKDRLEKAHELQRIYGGTGLAAVGIPGLAGVIAGTSAHRRRKAERELEAAMEEESTRKEASVNFAQQLGLRMGLGTMTKAAEPTTLMGLLRRAGGGIQGGAEWLGRKVSPPLATGLEFFGGARPAASLRDAVEISSGRRPRLPGVQDAADQLMRRVGYGTAGVGAAGAAGVTGAVAAPVIASKAKKKKKKDKGEKSEKSEKSEKKEAQLGTPFMDGFLVSCAKAGLDERQTVDVIEKIAQIDDRAGRECRAFLERLATAE